MSLYRITWDHKTGYGKQPDQAHRGFNTSVYGYCLGQKGGGAISNAETVNQALDHNRTATQSQWNTRLRLTLSHRDGQLSSNTDRKKNKRKKGREGEEHILLNVYLTYNKGQLTMHTMFGTKKQLFYTLLY